MFLNKNFSKLVIGFLLLACIWYGKNIDSWGRNRIIDNDVVSYYAYLPAGLIFHDLNFSFMKELPSDFDGKIWLSTAPNGKPILRMTMGLAFLWSPFFILAHLYAKISGISAYGYSWPYSLSIFIAAIAYLFIGLIFLRRILLKYFSDLTTGITLFLTVLASNLMYYVISEPGMSHVFSFALIILFFHYTLIWVEKPAISSSIILGSLLGLIVLIRPVNGLVVVLPALLAVRSLDEFKHRFTEHWRHILLAAIFAFAVLIPQMIYWKFQTGHFLFNSYMDSGRFYFFKPNLINGLLSFRKGWLIYTPVMLFSIVGLFFLKHYFKELLLSISVFLILFIYVVFSWWCWWYGGSYGARPMIDIYGILAIPLAAFLSAGLKSAWWKRGIVGLLFLFFVYLNQFQMSQYRSSLLHWDSMTPQAYRAIFLKKNWPDGYDKLIKVPDYEKALKGEE